VMGPKFFETRMGHKFYGHDVPEIAKQLKRLADAIEGIRELMEKKGEGDGKVD